MSIETIDAVRAAEAAEKLGFKSEDEFVEAAVETFLASRPDLKKELAAVLYEREEVSLGRAVEISGLSRQKFKELLDEKEISRKSGSIDDSVENIKTYRE